MNLEERREVECKELESMELVLVVGVERIVIGFKANALTGAGAAGTLKKAEFSLCTNFCRLETTWKLWFLSKLTAF